MKLKILKKLNDMNLFNINMFFITVLSIIFSNPVFAFADSKDLAKNFANFSKQYNMYIAIFIAIGFLTGVLGFIVNFIRLAKSGSNPRLRQEAIRNLLTCGITTLILANFGFFLGFYFKIIVG